MKIIIWLLLLACVQGFNVGIGRAGQGSHMLRSRTSLNAKLIVGVNKYSHDASCCIIDSGTGKILFTQAKERISNRKHDGGSAGAIVRYGLESIGAKLNDVVSVVSNNHHFRVLPFEQRIGFNKALDYIPSEYEDDHNLFPGAEKLELSHHLAHAWSVVGTAPFDQGLTLVMDGMGESRKAMMEDMLGLEEKSGDYMHDLKLLKLHGMEETDLFNHIALSPASTYREAETAYIFDRNKGIVKPVFKRWARERSPSELYNHGFENIDSIGAAYSRVSSHINGDWNACGKVMGLAPWAGRPIEHMHDWHFGPGSLNAAEIEQHVHKRVSIMSGNPMEKDSFKIDWKALEGLTKPNEWSDSRFGELASVAQSVQSDLEKVTLSLCESLREATQAENLALCGGVALNSVMNGNIRQHSGFKKVFVPSAPGDEGIALGCALYGLQRWREKQDKHAVGSIHLHATQPILSAAPVASPAASTQPAPSTPPTATTPIPIAHSPFSAYQGRHNPAVEIDIALLDADSWVDVESFPSEEALLADAVHSIATGKVVAWYQGRSEFGQRALGARSILADPRNVTLRGVINEKVKEREWYRPLAPSVLDEHVGDWFVELKNGENASPYMSLTATVRPEKASLVPAVCHIDNTARLQTVTTAQAPLYHRLLNAFFKFTGVPMVLNTSFNRKGQPIVETPAQAVETLLQSEHIDHLYIGLMKVTSRPFPFNMDITPPVETASVTAVEKKTAEPTEQEGAVTLCGSPIYLSEITSTSEVNDSEPLKIRIQAGRSVGAGDEEMGNEATPSWITLPSALHLDVLQLLQVTDEITADDFEDETIEVPADLSVKELLAALRTVETSGSRDSKKLSWSELKSALLWLYRRQLISFL